jgi:glycosyltransferase involved in cell wall biosynthesis
MRRVLVLAPRLPVDGELYGRAVVELLSGLSSRLALTLVALNPPPLDEGGCGPLRIQGLGGGGRASRLARLVQRVAAARPVDLVWALWLHRGGPVGAMVAGLLGRPLVVSALGGELAALPELGYGAMATTSGRARVRLALRAAKVLTVGSEPHRDAAASVLAGTSGRRPRIALSPLGIDPRTVAARERAPWSPGRPLSAVLVGGVAPVKRSALALAAVAELRARGVDARVDVFALDPAEGAAELSREAARLGLGAAFTHRGAVPPLEVVRRLASYDVLLHASAHESQGLALIEAALAGLPIAGPEVGVMRELSRLGAAVELAAPSAPALAEAALRAATRRSDARGVVAARFSLDAAIERFAGVLERAAAEGA